FSPLPAPPTPYLSPLSLHDALPIFTVFARVCEEAGADALSCINTLLGLVVDVERRVPRLAFGTGGLSGPAIRPIAVRMAWQAARDRKSTRLNSSHVSISYAVFCLKK